MILDTSLCLDPQGTALTAGGTSTNTLDMQAAPRDYAVGTNVPILIMGSGFVGAGTLTITLQGSPDNATWSNFADSGALTATMLNSNSAQNLDLWSIDLPGRPQIVSFPRYYRLLYTVNGGNFTAGTLGAWLVQGRDELVAYPSGFQPLATM